MTTANDTANRADAEARAARQQAAVVEARLAEEQGQREALEQLYSDLSRGRDEAVLVEVERLITVARRNCNLAATLPPRWRRYKRPMRGFRARTTRDLCRCDACWHAISSV